VPDLDRLAEKEIPFEEKREELVAHVTEASRERRRRRI